MELFDVVLYPIAELLKLIMSPQLEEALGFSLPTFMIGIFIASAFITTITGTISATQNLLGPLTPEAREYTDNNEIYFDIDRGHGRLLEEQRYHE